MEQQIIIFGSLKGTNFTHAVFVVDRRDISQFYVAIVSFRTGQMYYWGGTSEESFDGITVSGNNNKLVVDTDCISLSYSPLANKTESIENWFANTNHGWSARGYHVWIIGK